MPNTNSTTMLDAAIATGVSAAVPLKRGNDESKATFHAYGTTSAGSGSATIVIEVSNEASPSTAATAVDWITAGTITLTLGTTQVDDGFSMNAAWRWVRARLSAISGTDATVYVRIGA